MASKTVAKNQGNQPTCGAKKRNGDTCGSPYINPENGRCKNHGGGKGSGRPVIHGRYSKRIKSARILGRYQEYVGDPNLADLHDELARLLAYRDEWLDKVDESIEAGTPLSVDDREELRQWGEMVSRVSERANKIKYGERYTLTVEQASAFVTRFVDIGRQLVDRFVDDGKQKHALTWFATEVEKLG